RNAELQRGPGHPAASLKMIVGSKTPHAVQAGAGPGCLLKARSQKLTAWAQHPAALSSIVSAGWEIRCCVEEVNFCADPLMSCPSGLDGVRRVRENCAGATPVVRDHSEPGSAPRPIVLGRARGLCITRRRRAGGQGLLRVLSRRLR